MNEKCFIFTGGKEFYPEYVSKSDSPDKNSFIIAADSGCKNLLSFNKELCPNIILGDMDSENKEKAVKMFPSASFSFCAPEKDDTDTMIAVNCAINHGFCDIRILGGLGGRLDHTLSNIFMLQHIRENNAFAVITNGKNRIYIPDKNKSVFYKPDFSYKYISVIPIDEKLSGVTMTGFKYPLCNAVIYRKNAITISNELSQENAVISVDFGNFFIVESQD